MPTLFTTVGYLVSHSTSVLPGPCHQYAPVNLSGLRRGCDVDGFYMLERITIFTVVTSLEGGMCHILTTTVVEQYHSHEPCSTYEPPKDLGLGEEWTSYVDPEPFSWDVPQPEYPRQKLELPQTVTDPTTGLPVRVCENKIEVSYEVECVNAIIRVTRITSITISTPLASGSCRTLEYQVTEPYVTSEPCEPLDWDGAPEDFTGGHEPKKLWEEAVSSNNEPENRPDEGTLRVAREGNKSQPFRKAVREIKAKEHKKDASVDPSQDRPVYVRTLNGQPVEFQTLAGLEPGKPVSFEIALEGSEFSSTSEAVDVSGIEPVRSKEGGNAAQS